MDSSKNRPNKIVERDISKEMRESYLDYAMSVIISRALPDARDGLKPVHRRILYVMHEMGLNHSAKFRKCAAIVGDALGKYHPHGDQAVYDALARMAQDFSFRYPLIDGQGNFGSIDGDAPAAMRYTEAKMARISDELLADIEKETVDFKDNYDATRKEPVVLPATLPQLLLNGTLGIAVGMATNIPPHNLVEVVDATSHLLEHPRATIEDLLQFIKGPDFPTGGIIFNEKDIYSAYATGRGGIVTRGEAEIVESLPAGRQGEKTGHYQIIISSIPYQVNKSELVAAMANLVTEKKIEGIRDIRDESDKEGLTIAVDLKREANPQKILNNLYKHTDLEKVYHFNVLALVDGIQPQTLSLKDLLEQFIVFRKGVIERRAKFDLKIAQARVHILEGLKNALDHIDAVIKTIKSSNDKEDAHQRLVKQFKFSDKQAEAILEMKLQALANLERQKINDELKEKINLIKDLEALLKDPKRVVQAMKDELEAVKKKYGDERKTKIVKHPAKSLSAEDLVSEEEVAIVLTRSGYVKRSSPNVYRVQHRGGKGVIDISTKEEDFVTAFTIANTHDDLLLFTDKGKAFKIKVFELPEGKRAGKGKPIINFISLNAEEKVTSILVLPKNLKKEEASLVLITKNGVIKKVSAAHFEDVRRSGILALRLQKGDELDWAHLVFKGDHIILVTSKGQAIRFKESDARLMGRTAAGVKAMRLKKGDELIGSDVIGTKDKDLSLLTMSKSGYGKKTNLKSYRLQKRAGSGIKTSKVTEKTGVLTSAKVLHLETEEMIVISQKGQAIRLSISEVPELGRQTQGVKIMAVAPGDSIASLTCL
jgi:DNA gyrase subunit A